MNFPMLQYDIEGFLKSFHTTMMQTSNALITSIASDIKMKSKLSKAKDDVEADKAIMELGGLISATVHSYAWAIIDSFGTGSKSVISDPDIYSQYMDSEFWNPLRKGKNIVGRQEGEYINIFGEKSYSSGSSAGQPVNVPEIKPSYAIQQVEAIYFSSRIEIVLNEAVLKFMETEFPKFWITKKG